MDNDAMQRILHVVNYTKVSQSGYHAPEYEAAYHTLELDGTTYEGQRDVAKRLTKIDFDFKDKVVLDIGCNIGGMLHFLAKDIRKGIGIDYDSRCINAANIIKDYNQEHNLSFYRFDLDKEKYDLIKDFCLSETVDICFMFSLAAWVKKWKITIAFLSTISKTLLFETHGTPEGQKEQVEELGKNYSIVEKVISEDQTIEDRQMYFCQNTKLQNEYNPNLKSDYSGRFTKNKSICQRIITRLIPK